MYAIVHLHAATLCIFAVLLHCCASSQCISSAVHHFPGRWNVSAASRNHPPSSTCEDEDTPNKDENGEHDHDDDVDDDDGNDAVGDTEGDDDDDADNDRMMVCAVECGGAGTANPPPV